MSFILNEYSAGDWTPVLSMSCTYNRRKLIFNQNKYMFGLCYIRFDLMKNMIINIFEIFHDIYSGDTIIMIPTLLSHPGQEVMHSSMDVWGRSPFIVYKAGVFLTELDFVLPHSLQGQGLHRCVEEIVFTFTYPRLDMEVCETPLPWLSSYILPSIFILNCQCR